MGNIAKLLPLPDFRAVGIKTDLSLFFLWIGTVLFRLRCRTGLHCILPTLCVRRLALCIVHDLHAKIRTDAAAGAFPAPAVLRELPCFGLSVLAQQKFPRNTRRGMFPGERLIKCARALIVIGKIDATAPKCLQPDFVLEKIRPAIKFRALLPCLADDSIEPAVSPGQRSFQYGKSCIMVMEGNGPVADVFLQ